MLEVTVVVVVVAHLRGDMLETASSSVTSGHSVDSPVVWGGVDARGEPNTRVFVVDFENQPTCHTDHPLCVCVCSTFLPEITTVVLHTNCVGKVGVRSQVSE